MKIKIYFLSLLIFIGITIGASGGVKSRHIDFVSMPNMAEASVGKAGEAYIVTFEQLEQTRKYIDKGKKGEDITGFPEELLRLNGKLVKLTGNLLIPSEQYYMNEPLKNFAVSKNAFGCPCCTWGPPPTVFDSIFVTLKEGGRLDPPYSQYVTVTGIFKAEKSSCEDGRLAGLFYITNATAEKVKKSFLSSIF
ncbi:MAG: hypothetical protein PHI59_00110 [Candidatus Omnitrophica bacterium]|nr:hypothetical protein [Candidatus Omnitrophota bacterium]